ncbi:hypothetical protein [Arthrobacter sp. KNU40]|uniref:hypothetical protein n=1 Tax=Arthrobacter sp. KNU40 TaxID=3447965 RepID=UPI003F62D7D4
MPEDLSFLESETIVWAVTVVLGLLILFLTMFIGGSVLALTALMVTATRTLLPGPRTSHASRAVVPERVLWGPPAVAATAFSARNNAETEPSGEHEPSSLLPSQPRPA